MNENYWNFPGNNFGPRMGLNDSDSEMFRDNSVASLAREILQNSIDAKLPEGKCVRVEFNLFEKGREELPDIGEIEKQIRLAIETRTGWSNKDILEKLNDMLKCVANRQTFDCLRISDFNTTGLTGISSKDPYADNSWNSLIRESGESNKDETSGGSKGVGKFASFVNSDFGTVLYSSKTVDDEEGWIGIAKLCSAKKGEEGELTQGIGYYCSDEKNSVIPGQLINFDPDFIRKDSGTDIYIIGFSSHDDWESEVIIEVLDSFMVAIMNDELEVIINKKIINKDTLPDFVLDRKLINTSNTKGHNIMSQYLILTRVETPEMIQVGDYGSAALYVLDCSEENKEFSTDGECIMVRYPNMKIKNQSIDVSAPFATMCILQKDELTEMLRKAENAQHRNFEFDRLKSKPATKKKIQGAYENLLKQIENYLEKMMSNIELKKINFEGAEDIIPMTDNSDDGTIPVDVSSDNKRIKIDPILSGRRQKRRSIETSPIDEDENGNGVILDFSDESEEGENEIITPEGHNSGEYGDIKLGDNERSVSSSDDAAITFRRDALRSLKCRFLLIDRKKGLFGLKILAETDIPEIEFKLYEVGDNYERRLVTIYSATSDNEVLYNENFTSIFTSLKAGVEKLIEIETDRQDLFGAEVLVK